MSSIALRKREAVSRANRVNHRLTLIVLLLLVTAFTTSACSSPDPAIIAEPTPSPAPTLNPISSSAFDEKIDVGGYALHILCTGQGTPTVVVEAAFGEAAAESDSSSWKTVTHAISQTTRICVYSRAGLGSSDVAPGETRTSEDIARDLHALLVNANVPGPYVLVGHSIGGYHVRVFAGTYPNQVAGVVLVDSSHPDQWEEARAVLPPESPDEPDGVRRLRTIPPASLPEKLDVPASAAQVRAFKSLGDIPLVVLSHSPDWPVPDVPPDVAEKIEGVWERLQNDLAGLSSNSTHITAARAGHYIQVDEPQLVIDAILQVIKAAGGA